MYFTFLLKKKIVFDDALTSYIYDKYSVFKRCLKYHKRNLKLFRSPGVLEKGTY